MWIECKSCTFPAGYVVSWDKASLYNSYHLIYKNEDFTVAKETKSYDFYSGNYKIAVDFFFACSYAISFSKSAELKNIRISVIYVLLLHSPSSADY